MLSTPSSLISHSSGPVVVASKVSAFADGATGSATVPIVMVTAVAAAAPNSAAFLPPTANPCRILCENATATI